MNQKTLFDTGYPAPAVARNARETSRAAAEKVAPHVETKARMVLEAIEQAGRAGAIGLTCYEVECRLQMCHQTASARIADLHKKLGLIEDSGEKRPTASGCKAIVWRRKK